MYMEASSLGSRPFLVWHEEDVSEGLTLVSDVVVVGALLCTTVLSTTYRYEQAPRRTDPNGRTRKSSSVCQFHDTALLVSTKNLNVGEAE